MHHQIYKKIRASILPITNIGAASLFYFSIAGILGIGKLSDNILLIIGIQNSIGTIAQISWYGMIPSIYQCKETSKKNIIISNSLYSCLTLNILIAFIIYFTEKYTRNYTNPIISIYSIAFQVHQLYKNIYLINGEFKKYYLLDCIGYLTPIPVIYIIHTSVINENKILAYIFVAIAVCWLIIAGIDILLNKRSLTRKPSLTIIKESIYPTIPTRMVNALYIIKDILVPIALNKLGGIGGLTTYSYINRVGVAIFQAFPIYGINRWVYQARNDNNLLSKNEIKKVATKALLIFSAPYALTILTVTITIIITGKKSFFTAENNLLFLIFCTVINYLLYGIQSYEQPYARYAYLSKSFSTSTTADLKNVIIFSIVFFIGYTLKFIEIALISNIIAQIASLRTYQNYLENKK